MKTNNQNGIVLPIVILLIAIVGGLVGFKAYQQYQKNQQAGLQKAVVKQVVVRRSKIPNVIAKATTAKAIDVKTGKVITAARVFSPNDKTVYLALDLDSAKNGTSIDYIRYLNGRYVDHGNAKLNKDLIANISFSWTNIKPIGSVTDGNWKIATYTNGILEKRVNYTVKKNEVASVYIEDTIQPSDSDYQLSRTVALLSIQQ